MFGYYDVYVHTRVVHLIYIGTYEYNYIGDTKLQTVSATGWGGEESLSGNKTNKSDLEVRVPGKFTVSVLRQVSPVHRIHPLSVPTPLTPILRPLPLEYYLLHQSGRPLSRPPSDIRSRSFVPSRTSLGAVSSPQTNDSRPTPPFPFHTPPGLRLHGQDNPLPNQTS